MRVQVESDLLEYSCGSCSNGQWVAKGIITRPVHSSVPRNEIHKKKWKLQGVVFVCICGWNRLGRRGKGGVGNVVWCSLWIKTAYSAPGDPLVRLPIGTWLGLDKLPLFQQ